MTNSAKYWIENLKLQPHPEGGYFKEMYRSNKEINIQNDTASSKASRNLYTSIYFLLEGNNISHFHILKQDELWYFHRGSAIKIYQIHSNGELSITTLGGNPQTNQKLQWLIPGKTYFAAEIEDKNAFALVGCMVCPGFDFADFQMPEKSELIKTFPQHTELIKKLAK